MSWNTIQPTEVVARLTSAERKIYNLSADAAPLLTTVLNNVVNGVRDAIKAGGNQLDQSGPTIPDMVREEVIALAVWKFFLAYPPIKITQSDTRKEAGDAAQKKFDLIASTEPGRPRMPLPPTADATPSALPEPSFGNRHIEFNRRNQEG